MNNKLISIINWHIDKFTMYPQHVSYTLRGDRHITHYFNGICKGITDVDYYIYDEYCCKLNVLIDKYAKSYY